MDFKEAGCMGSRVYWIYVAQDRVQLRAFASTLLNIHVPKDDEEFLDKLSDCYLKNDSDA
jgi:hypothetical protein